MTADGTDDDLIKLEGWPEGKKYEFMDAELDEDSGSDDDLELMMHDCFVDIPEMEPPIPDEDGEDVLGDPEFEEVDNDPDEYEASDEPFECPNGYEAIPDVPDIRKLSGMTIMFLWDFGWDKGVVKNKIRKGEYNYFVQYSNDDGTYNEYRQKLTVDTYHNIDDGTGYWIALSKELLA